MLALRKTLPEPVMALRTEVNVFSYSSGCHAVNRLSLWLPEERTRWRSGDTSFPTLKDMDDSPKSKQCGISKADAWDSPSFVVALRNSMGEQVRRHVFGCEVSLQNL